MFVMRGPSFRGRELDTYSIEAVPQATKLRGSSPRECRLGNRLSAHWLKSAGYDWLDLTDRKWLISTDPNSNQNWFQELRR